MFCLWPGEFIHPLTTSSGVCCPYAIFSPIVLKEIPKSPITVLQADPSGLVWSNTVIISCALTLAALHNVIFLPYAGNPSFDLSIFTRRITSSTYGSFSSIGAGLFSIT